MRIFAHTHIKHTKHAYQQARFWARTHHNTTHHKRSKDLPITNLIRDHDAILELKMVVERIFTVNQIQIRRQVLEDSLQQRR